MFETQKGTFYLSALRIYCAAASCDTTNYFVACFSQTKIIWLRGDQETKTTTCILTNLIKAPLSNCCCPRKEKKKKICFVYFLNKVSQINYVKVF